MAKIMQATDALARAKGTNSGIDALVSLMMATKSGPNMNEVAEILWAIHDQMKGHLAEIERALDD